jgi:hypothetical protein
LRPFDAITSAFLAVLLIFLVPLGLLLGLGANKGESEDE